MNQRKQKVKNDKGLRQGELTRAQLRPLEHLEVAPSHIQGPLLKLIEALPLLMGDELWEALEEPHAAVNMERALARRSRLCCELAPQAPQKLKGGRSPRRPLEGRAVDCLVLLASQRTFLAPCAPRPRQSLKDALDLAEARFKAEPDLKLILIASDSWDMKLMRERRATFEAHLRAHGQVLIPTLHHGGLLTPICYL